MEAGSTSFSSPGLWVTLCSLLLIPVNKRSNVFFIYQLLDLSEVSLAQ